MDAFLKTGTKRDHRNQFITEAVWQYLVHIKLTGVIGGLSTQEVIATIAADFPSLHGKFGESKIAQRLKEKIEPSLLIAKSEVENVLGEAVRDSSPTSERDLSKDGYWGLLLSTCSYFTSATPSKSVTVQIVQEHPGNPTKRRPMDYWQNQKEQERQPIELIPAVGTEAYWVLEFRQNGFPDTHGLSLKSDFSYLRLKIGESPVGL